MDINWLLVLLVVVISVPGVFVVMPRYVAFLLPKHSIELKRKATRFVIGQSILLVLAMSVCGVLLSSRTGLQDPLLHSLMQGQFALNSFLAIFLPVLGYSLLVFFLFCILYYGVVHAILDTHSLEVLRQLRLALKLDGCLLYGGISEEVIARWGLMNLVTFFSLLFAQQVSHHAVVTASLFISSLMFAVGQIPAYIAAGCVASRRFAYSFVLLSLCQSLVFGLVFWQYGLIASIMAHVLFHLFWASYDRF